MSTVPVVLVMLVVPNSKLGVFLCGLCRPFIYPGSMAYRPFEHRVFLPGSHRYLAAVSCSIYATISSLDGGVERSRCRHI
ncbi:hypothetical protein EDD16DRAFT_1552799 [Pisolithus croceorrhizus]|nr:hypothetical protein EDD16DRAFT_1552799 [Pisolithus croceorrhizus]